MQLLTPAPEWELPRQGRVDVDARTSTIRTEAGGEAKRGRAMRKIGAGKPVDYYDALHEIEVLNAFLKKP